MERHPAETPKRPSWRRSAAALAIACGVFVAFNLAFFRTPFYRSLLDPESGTGTFERAIATLRERKVDPARDVLVLGDSRIYDGLLPDVAARAAGGGLRFVRAAVPGTTPRCWRFFAEAIDPDAVRFRALVIPVDTLGDDDSAIGSEDANDREADLRFLVYEIDPGAFAAIARSFDPGFLQSLAASELLLAGPLLRDDVRDLLADPAARFRALADARPFDLAASHARSDAPLRGLRANFGRSALAVPASVSAAERGELERQILPIPHHSDVYAAYRRDWLAPLVRAYRAAGRPVVFVRIPTRPLHRSGVDRVSGTIAEFARDGADVVDPAPYLALERPRLFGDHDHLNDAGARLFSRQFGRDVAAALGR